MSLLIALLRLKRGLKKLGTSKESGLSKELLAARWSQLEQALLVRGYLRVPRELAPLRTRGAGGARAGVGTHHSARALAHTP